MSLRPVLAKDSDKNDVTFHMLGIDDRRCASDQIFSYKPASQEDIVFRIAGHDCSLPIS